MYHEIIILNRILPPHKHILQIKDILIGPNTINLVTELCSTQTLKDFFPGATNATAARIFKQLATTVHFIHQHGVVHNDLKSVNVLFASAGMRDIKIIDFGISAYYETMATRTYHNFNPRSWFAEEELRQAGDGYASPFGDVEQLGNLLHCMLSGRDIDPTDWTDPEPDPEPRTDIFDDNALHLFGLIGPYEHRADPSARLPELEQILQHPWLR